MVHLVSAVTVHPIPNRCSPLYVPSSIPRIDSRASGPSILRKQSKYSHRAPQLDNSASDNFNSEPHQAELTSTAVAAETLPTVALTTVTVNVETMPPSAVETAPPAPLETFTPTSKSQGHTIIESRKIPTAYF